MTPVKIEIEEGKTLKIIWDDGSLDRIGLDFLRKNCPCAICTSQPAGSDEMVVRIFGESQTQVASIQVVGQYAINIAWKDGHNTGIYEFDYLKELAELNKPDAKEN